MADAGLTLIAASLMCVALIGFIAANLWAATYLEEKLKVPPELACLIAVPSSLLVIGATLYLLG